LLYFAEKLSPNMARSAEGYLICRNVPVARVGVQEYLTGELGLPFSPHRVPVHRLPEEVFSPACIASFEGKPVTEDHPADPEGVTAENIHRLQKGHAQNIRRGEGPDSNLLLACLFGAVWVFTPTFGQAFLWLDGSCNYGWGSALGLWWLLPYVRRFLRPQIKYATDSLPLIRFFNITASRYRKHYAHLSH